MAAGTNRTFRTSHAGRGRQAAGSSIVQQVEALRRERQHRPVLAQLAAILDGLNAWDAVDARRAGLSPLLSGGPKVSECVPCAGLHDCDAFSVYAVGVVVWHRAAGYHGYKVLTVGGVWVCQTRAGETRLVVGNKSLPFAPPFFDPEPYHKLFRRDYATYYRDDGLPPTHDRVHTIPYMPEERPQVREWLLNALNRR